VRIDSHVEFIEPEFGPEVLGPVLRNNRMDGCIVWQASRDADEASRLMDAAAQHPFILGVVLWTGCASPWKGHPKLKGVRADRWLEGDGSSLPLHVPALPAGQPDRPVIVSRLDGSVDIERAAAMDQVYVSLPGMSGPREELRPYIHEIFRHFAPERMLYGSDWPACRLKNASWKGMLATFTQACGG
jgi:L-fuconolactonase